MMTVAVLYGGTTISACETAWATSDPVTGVTNGTGTGYVGTNCITSVIAAGASAGTVCSEIVSLDLSAYTHIAAWVKSTVATALGDFQLLLSENGALASPSESLDIPALVANTWTRCVWAFAAATTTRDAIVSVGIKMITDSILTLSVDDVLAFNGGIYNNVLLVRGVDDVDDIVELAADPVQLLDGSYFAYAVPAWNRVVTIDFGAAAITTKAQRTTLKNAWQSSEQRIIYGGSEVTTVRSGSGLSSTWLDGLEFAKDFTLKFLEKTARTTDPAEFT